MILEQRDEKIKKNLRREQTKICFGEEPEKSDHILKLTVHFNMLVLNNILFWFLLSKYPFNLGV